MVLHSTTSTLRLILTSTGTCSPCPASHTLPALQAGIYNLSVMTVPTAILNTTNSPLSFEVHPNVLWPPTSSMTIANPAGVHAGTPALVSMTFADQYTNPINDTSSVLLAIVGRVTGTQNVGNDSFIPTMSMGSFTYRYTFGAIQNITFTLYFYGGLAAGPLGYMVRGVDPGAVRYDLSVANATAQLDGSLPSAPRPRLPSVGPIPANAWHVAHVPVVRAAAALGPFVGDPWLNASLTIFTMNATGAVNLTSSRAFIGFWSWSNGTYVVPFKLTADPAVANNTFAATLRLAHPSGVGVSGAGGDGVTGTAGLHTLFQR